MSKETFDALAWGRLLDVPCVQNTLYGEAMRLTNIERKMLRDAAEFVLAGEWPWEPEKARERDALTNASRKLKESIPAGALLAIKEGL